MWKNKKLGIAADLLWILLLSVFAFYVNRDIVIKGLYMDDLYMWSCYGEQSLAEFAFPIGTSTRFRPVYWLATYLQMAIVGNHISWFVPFNIICNIIVALSLYYIIRKISRYRLLGFFGGLCYLASRFAYYQLGQALGLMETLALFMAIWILYLLYRYLNEANSPTAAELVADGEAALAESKKGPENGNGHETGKGPEKKSLEKKSLHVRLVSCGDWRYALALLLYFLIVFVHERYLSLLPLFYLVLLLKLANHRKGFRKAYFREQLRYWIAPAAVFLVITLIRTLCIGTAIPAGTGGTEVTETFRLSEAIGFALSQVLYIFGINAGPEHLCGLPWDQSPAMIKALVKVSIIALFVICMMFAITLLLDLAGRDREGRKRFFRILENVLLFLLFIAMCIGCSSVTIRVEMRWIYVSYTAAVIFCTYMIREIVDNYRLAFADGGQAEGNAEPGDAGASSGESSGAEPGAESDAVPDTAPQDPAKALAEAAQDNIFRHAGERVTDRILRPSVVAALLILIFGAYTALSLCTNMFYRTYYPKLYFWPDQLRMNSLAEETYEKYGDSLFGKDIYILENSYGMSDFYKDTFFKTFDKDKKAEGTEVFFADSVADIPEEAIQEGNIIVVQEVPEENAYRDVTEEVLSGSWQDL